MNRFVRYFVYGLFGLLFCSCVAIALSPDDEQSVSEQAPEATAGIAADDVPADEPTTTEAPEPTETAESEFEPAEREYASFLLGVLDVYQKSFPEIGALMTEVGQDTSLLNDQQWKFALVAEMVKLDEASQKVLDRTEIPPRLEAVHEKYKEVATAAIDSTKSLRQAIDNLDIELLAESMDGFNQVRNGIDEAKVLMDEVLAE